MRELFFNVINASISGSLIILIVLLVQLIFKKMPKWVNMLLWAMVAIRLVCPISIESEFSLMPKTESIKEKTFLLETDISDIGIRFDDHETMELPVDIYIKGNEKIINDISILMVLAMLWLVGCVGMSGYMVHSYWRINRMTRMSILLRKNIYQCENVESPFVFGIIKPKIYIPYNVEEHNIEHIIAHEETHINRKDHWWKTIGYLLLSIHWFNPIMWIGYNTLCRDIELACDEKVIKRLGDDKRADYSQALLDCSLNKSKIMACPLAFGEVCVKERVKNILNYRKTPFWILIVTTVVLIVVAVCFLTNPKDESYILEMEIPAGSKEYIYSNDIIQPMDNKLEIYIGKNTGDVELILKPMNTIVENVERPSDIERESVVISAGKTVKLDVKRNAIYKVGIKTKNKAENILTNIKIEDVAVIEGVNLEDYRTPYIGEHTKVSVIAHNLPYPKEYYCDTIELQTKEEPYELIVNMCGTKQVTEEEFEECATKAFDLIGNMGIITFYNQDKEEVIATFSR